jgi:hypothetical protein
MASGSRLGSLLNLPDQQIIYRWNFYQTLMPTSLRTDAASGLRGWQMAGGSASAIVQPPPGFAHNQTSSQTNWHARLIEAQARLMYEFHHWLRSAELYEIRAEMARASREWGTVHATGLDIFLTCDPIELARFPWESWEISNEFAAIATVRIVRVPINVSQPPNQVSSPSQKQRSRARILAVMGDETGLSFQLDRMVVQSLYRLAEIKFVGWQPGRDVETVKREIVQAIADERGWDVLFFAGHSNETELSGGELGIAPGVSIAVSEIAPQLAIAKERGLQFALFNSCSGLNIAETLIGLGLSQVAVMREPVHNRVAQEFLVTFLKGLEQFKDVHEALLEACQVMKLEKNLTFPSAWLVPSLFCHPGAEWFRLQPFGWRQKLRRWKPNRLQAGALAAFLLLGLLPPKQNPVLEYLLDQRVGAQAVYRHITGRIPPTNPPPVLLVQINDESIGRDRRISTPHPINQSYMADVINRLNQLNARVIGIDYAFDRPAKNESEEQALRQAIQNSVRDRTWFVFMFDRNNSSTLITSSRSELVKGNWILQGFTNPPAPNRVAMPYAGLPGVSCFLCPFTNTLSIAHLARQDNLVNLPSPNLNNQGDFQKELMSFLEKESSKNPKLAQLQEQHTPQFAQWIYLNFNKLPWFNPITDLSIPPGSVYNRLSSWRLLEDQSLELPDLSQQIVIVASGAYVEAGIDEDKDYRELPSASRYWQSQNISTNATTFPAGSSQNSTSRINRYTGGESLAYGVHHALTQRLVVPIPDILIVGCAGLLGKGVFLLRKRQQGRQRDQYFLFKVFASTLLYGFFALELYVSAAILLPWLLPSAMFWISALPSIKGKAND